MENIMRVINDYGLVRVVSLGDPYTQVADIVVEIKAGNQWEYYAGFNSLSDDYAYTNAKEAAGRAIKKMAAEKAALITA
jgi:hypothetical protein